MKLPKKLGLRIFLSGLLLLISLFLLSPQPVLAQAGQTWIPDPEVTALGKSSERARQLLWWFFENPSLDNSPAIQKMWAVSRNIAAILLLVVIIAYGFQLILSREKAKFEALLPKLMALMVFAFFSYVLILGLIQISDVVMKFFIEQVAGGNLFNITFIGPNAEQSYIDFIGFRRQEPEFMESARTAFTVIRLTNFTYNVMFVMLVVRKIILWFLLILAPFLAVLFAFPFIKNIGWIWIGVFFQWLFYGPLFSIFLAALVRIWEFGIPFRFNFQRAQNGEVVYPTAINILYGGPAQLLNPTNTASYVDTYAEYLIGIIMLWAVTFLPWWLLRIFRDYCCEVIKSLEAATMNLYGKLGGISPPPPPTMPGLGKIEIPFKKKIDVELSNLIRSREETSVSRMQTQEILNSIGLKTSSLTEISKLDMNEEMRKMAAQKLEYLQAPSKVTSATLRGQFAASSQELANRAAKGDVVAERTLSVAAKVPVSSMVRVLESVRIGVPERVAIEKKEGVVSTTVIPRRGAVGTGMKAKLKKGAAQPTTVTAAAPARTVSIEDYEETKRMWTNNYRNGEVPLSEKIKSREEWLRSEVAKVSDTIEMISSKDSEKKSVGFENLAGIMPFLFLGGFSEEQILVYLRAKLEAAKSQLETEAVPLEGEEAEEEMVKIKRFEKEQEKEQWLEQSLELEKDKNEGEAEKEEAGTGEEEEKKSEKEKEPEIPLEEIEEEGPIIPEGGTPPSMVAPNQNLGDVLKEEVKK